MHNVRKCLFGSLSLSLNTPDLKRISVQDDNDECIL